MKNSKVEFPFSILFMWIDMQRIYYLKTCSTCQRILKSHADSLKGFELINIKENPITDADLAMISSKTDSIESFFSKRSQSYKKMNLKDKSLSDQEMKDLMKQDYTFLKRPVIIDGDSIFIGSDKKTLEKLEQHLLC
jgi:arsenate reductase